MYNCSFGARDGDTTVALRVVIQRIDYGGGCLARVLPSWLHIVLEWQPSSCVKPLYSALFPKERNLEIFIHTHLM